MKATNAVRATRALALVFPMWVVACGQEATQQPNDAPQASDAPTGGGVVETDRAVWRNRFGHRSIGDGRSVRDGLTAVLPDVGRPTGGSMLAASTPGDDEQVNETLDDGTIITGTRDSETGAFDLTYSHPDGTTSHVVGTQTGAHAEYAVDWSDGAGTTVHWDVVEDENVDAEGNTVRTLSAQGQVASGGRAARFAYSATELERPDGSATIDESYDDLDTPAAPDATLHVELAADGSFTAVETMIDEMGVHSCSYSGTVESGVTSSQCDGEEIPACAYDNSCETTCDRPDCEGTGMPEIGAGVEHAARACDDDAACGGGWCLVADVNIDAAVAPRGYCATFCNADLDCGEGWSCLPTSDDGSTPGICALGCAADADCGFEGGHCALPPPEEAAAGVPGLCVQI